MNSVNASTGFSPFQLRMGRSPRIIPPIVPSALPITDSPDPADLIRLIDLNVSEAKDNLLLAKTIQAFHANQRRGPEEHFKKGDKVMLATLHCRQEYKHRSEKRVAKFFPRFDGPYSVTNSHPESSSYTLDMSNSEVYPVFHASELKRYHPNDPVAYPSRELERPGPILTPDGLEEFLVQEIIDSRRRGRGWQYLVRWAGYGPEHDLWLPRSQLNKCQALDDWLAAQVEDSPPQ